MPVSLLACAGAGSANSVGGGPSSLLTGLAAYWKLDEASGTRADSLGAEPLTDNNTVTSAAGKIGNAAQFTAANSESLDHADDATLSMGPGVRMSLVGWWWFTSVDGGIAFVSKFDALSFEYLLRIENTGLCKFWVSPEGSSLTNVGTVVPSLGAWHFVAARYDGTTISLRVDAGAWETTAYTGDIFNGISVFTIGLQPSFGLALDGRADEVGLWKVALSDAQVTSLWAGGLGTTYPFTGVP